MYTKTHQCVGKSLLHVYGYRWELGYRPQPRTAGGMRGSGGVLYFLNKTCKRQCMWYTRMWMHDICGFACPQVGHGMCILIAVCYFPLAYSRYASQGGSPYMPLYEDMTRFSSLEDALLVGDFHARTWREQTVLYTMDEPMYHESATDEMGTKRSARHMGEVTWVWETFSGPRSANGMVIRNGLACWPGSDALTCWNHQGGASTVDYLMGSPGRDTRHPFLSI